MTKILALGFLPYWKGGKQTSGLATGIFDLHNSVNELNGNYEVVLACTDVKKQELWVDSTRVIGWNPKLLFLHVVRFFYKIPFFLFRTTFLYFKFGYPFLNTLVKSIFLDYAINIEKPNAIHLHGISNSLYALLLWYKIPLLLRLHGINGYNETIQNHALYRKREQFVKKIPFKFVSFVSEKNASDWQRYYGTFNCPQEVVINGFNSKLFYPEEHQQINIEYDLITIAAIDENKGQRRILEALNKLKNEGISLTYLIIGTGQEDYVNSIKEYASINNLKVSFKKHCPQSDLRNNILKSKYYILASAAEGFGKAIVESMACGKPAIFPRTIPIANEPFISTKNSILLNDETSLSIYEGLKQLPDYLTFNSKEIATSINSLSWREIAIKYSTLYQKYEI